jgi:predicted  nucleic acid-binding Zn-ribbon protein
MFKTFSIILFLFVAFGLLTVSINAQIDASTPYGRPRQEEPLPKNVQETLKKNELKQLQKDYDAMLANSEEAVKLSEELENSFEKNNKLNSNDVEKLEKIEKLLKKIRKELGGDADGEEDKTEIAEKPSNIKNAISTLKESAVGLYDELKKTSRYSISVVAIQSSNTLINIVRYIRFWKK